MPSTKEKPKGTTEDAEAPKRQALAFVDPHNETERPAHRAVNFDIRDGCMTISFATARLFEEEPRHRYVITSRVLIPMAGAFALYDDLGKTLTAYRAHRQPVDASAPSH